MNVIIIDNNFSIRQVLGTYIKQLSKVLKTEATVYTAEDGVEGLGLIYVTSPGLIIIDTTLPRYSGKEVIDFLVNNHSLQQSRIPVLVLHEDESLIEGLPDHFTLLAKTSNNLFLEIAKSFYKVNEQDVLVKNQKTEILAKVCRTVVRLSNKIDIRANSNKESIREKVQDSAIWLSGEVVTSFVLLFLFIFYGRLKDGSIQQRDLDNALLRVKYLPVISIAIMTTLLMAINTYLNLAFFLSNTKEVAAATTFTVDSVADTGDFSAGDGVCDIDNGVGDGPCTFRAAIQEANALAGADTIEFNIAGGGPHTITLTTLLPTISEQLHIDGYTQPGSSVNTLDFDQGSNAVLQIELDGNSWSVLAGLYFDNAPSSSIRGLVINGFDDSYAVRVRFSDNTQILGNFVGTDSSGSTLPTLNNQGNFYIDRSSNVVIGSTNNQDRNIIAGGSTHGVNTNQADNISILGNYFGVGKDGTTPIDFGGGTYFNISMSSSDNATIGNSILGNIISAADYLGISTSSSDNLSIENNYIGLAIDGLTDVGNGNWGIQFANMTNSNITNNVIAGNGNWGVEVFQGSNNTVADNIIGLAVDGDTIVANANHGLYLNNAGQILVDSNVISGNSANGIYILDGDAATITDNIIGLSSDGTTSKANGGDGIRLSSALDTQIGGNLPNTGNTISGNSANGVYILNSNSATITNNIIGLSSDGITSRANVGDGIEIDSSDNIQIGGATSNTGNIISSNSANGVLISNSDNTTLEGNVIGLASDGSTDRGNTSYGINLTGGTGNTIGGTTSTTPEGSCTGSCNVITGNTAGGIYINTVGINSIQGNFVGLTSNGTNTATTNGNGIEVVKSGGLTIGGSAPARNNIAGNNSDDIFIKPGIGNIVTNTTIDHNYIGISSNGILRVSTTDGIYIDGSLSTVDTVDITYNSIVSGLNGISLYESGINSANINNNNIGFSDISDPVLGFAVAHNLGMYILGTNGITIGPNNIIKNSGNSGLQLDNALNTNINNNQIIYNASNGIHLVDGDRSTTIDSNDISYNSSNGIYILTGSRTNHINNNTISNNTEYGIKIFETTSPETLNKIDITNNIIYDNGLLGIELDNDDVTPNDAGDSDTGENGLQNYPVITSVSTQDGDTNIDFSLDTVAGDYLIEFFENSTQDSSGYGEGENMFCSDTITHGGTGSEDFSISCTTDPTANYFITATATIDNGGGDYDDTSEFSSNNVISNHAPVAVNDSTSLNTNTSKTINVKSNDSDPNGSDDIVSLNITLDAINGSTQIISGKVKYTPDTDFSGNDSFKYEICDASSLCDSATVSITVISLNSTITHTPTKTPTTTPSPDPSNTTSPTAGQNPVPTTIITASPTTRISSGVLTPTATPPSITPTNEIVEPDDPDTQLDYTVTPTPLPSPTSSITGEIKNVIDERRTLNPITLIKDHPTTSSILGALSISIPVVATTLSSPGTTLYGMLWLTFWRRKRPWGLVYDAVNRTPLAFVTLYVTDVNKKSLFSVSNLEGKYQVFPEPGRYSIVAKHNDYQSQTKMINVDKNGPTEFIEFAMQPEGEAKQASSQLTIMNFFTINKIIFLLALIYTLMITWVHPHPINLLILGLLLMQVIIVFIIGHNSSKSWGYLKDQAGNPIIQTFVRLYKEDQQIDVTISNKIGAYGFLAATGSYQLRVDEHQIIKNGEIKQDIDIYVGKDGSIREDLTLSRTIEAEGPIKKAFA